jgi:hypothetical protein
MISKPILYKNSDEQHYKAEFYFYPLKLHIKLPSKFGKWLWNKWKW